MIILGAKPAQHDACFALLKDGEPLFVYEQERFNRIKHGMSCDPSVMLEAMREHGVRLEDVDLVTNAIDSSLLPEREAQVRSYQDGPAAAVTAEYLRWRLPTWRRTLSAAGFADARIRDIRHHLCHCAGVYYASPFEEAAILSIDGSGETETAMLAHGVTGQIEILRTTPHPHSLGHFYQAATHWLGWDFGEEGKTMALAAYGVPRHYRRLRDEVIDWNEAGDFALLCPERAGSFSYSSRDLATRVFAAMFGPARSAQEELTPTHKDVAASVQMICDEIMLACARQLKAQTGSARLLVAGGVGLNSVSNGLILREKLFDEVLVYPQANDTGTALGGALYAHHNLVGISKPRRWVMRHAFWGRQIDLENLEAAAQHFGLHGERPADRCGAAARILAEGGVLGWVQGRAEVGPRALGHRSILASPLAPGIKDKVNARVKHRELWRPFAPSVIEEDLGLYFEAKGALPYMTIVASLRPEWRDRLDAIAHIDGTARVQTVNRRDTPDFYALIEAFRDRTGVGMLLNTSFNDRGEPLVQTCEQAFELFLRSEMDALVIGEHLFVAKPGDRTIPPFSPYRFNLRKLPRQRLLVFCDGDGDGDCDGFAPMLAHLVDLNPEVAILSRGPLDGFGAYADALRTRFRRVDALEPDMVRGWDGLVVCMPVSADAFVFDRGIYASPIAELSRSVVTRMQLPVFWIDRLGDVTPMDRLLYAHHLAPAAGYQPEVATGSVAHV